MSRYNESGWVVRRTDSPTTYYEAAVFVDKIKHYLMQVDNDNYYHGGCSQILSTAHGQINTSDWRIEYVSTYIDKSANVQAQEVYVDEVQKCDGIFQNADCADPDCWCKKIPK